MKLSDGVVFAIFLLLAAMYNSNMHPVQSGEGTTYIVRPASDEMRANETYTGPSTSNIGFWQLPLWVLFVQLQPFFEYSVLRQFGALLSYKWLNGDPLGNEIRLRIFEYIKNNPGARFISIIRETGINRGTALYHLGVLEYFGLIAKFKSGITPCIFKTAECTAAAKRLFRWLCRSRRSAASLNFYLKMKAQQEGI